MEALPSSSSLASTYLPPVLEDPTPLSKALPYLVSFLTLLQHVALSIWSILQWILIFLSPLPALVYLMSPLIFFLDLCVAIFLTSPYRALMYILEAVQPLYVLCGVACITGGIMGLSGRWISGILVRWAKNEQIVMEKNEYVYREVDDDEQDSEEEYDEAEERLRRARELDQEKARQEILRRQRRSWSDFRAKRKESEKRESSSRMKETGVSLVYSASRRGGIDDTLH
ncbi:hypothetical protein CVT24_003779 [Panaeolus cyanescens]|uniref:Uncharacterized protein n=1 Tax=Panaeolus cyanescens TaxID=181874 RepID=A0A409VUR9_9AGAR|nr:hypothetical protein CVT24_003779 [Panaeolus cyanescens]